LSELQEEVLTAFKDAIELGDVESLLALNTLITRTAESLCASSPHAAIGVYSKLGYALNALAKKSETQYEHAIQALHLARQIAQREKDLLAQEALCYQLGLAHHFLKRYEGALDWFSQYIAFARQNGDSAGERDAFVNLAHASQKMGKHEQALEWYLQALQMTEEGAGSTLAANINRHMGLSYEALASYERAAVCHRCNFEHCIAMSDIFGQGIATNNLARALMMQGKYEDGVKMYTAHLSYARELHDAVAEAATLANLGLCNSAMGVFPQAVRWNLQHLEIAKSLGDTLQWGRAHGRLAQCYLEIGDIGLCLDAANIHLRSATELNDELGQAVGRPFCARLAVCSCVCAYVGRVDRRCCHSIVLQNLM
jgi:tetratricopeptide (TPR) repeat protein